MSRQRQKRWQNNPERPWRWLAAVTAALFTMVAGAVLACGPYFEQRLLTSGEAAVFRAPVGRFVHEIDRLKAEPPLGLVAVPPEGHASPYEQTADVDVAELDEALAATGLTGEERGPLREQYRALRRQLGDFQRAAADHRERAGADEDAPQWQDQPQQEAMLERLPPEFALYTRGAIERVRGDGPAARRHWRQLLALPVDQRRYRTTWAAYMIGRSYVDDAPAEAAPWFERTRQLAAEGFLDPLGLAAASLGWEGRAALQQGQHERAIELYLAQRATGDPGAVASLAICARQVLGSEPAVQRRVARHETAQRVVTAYLLAQVDWRWTTEPRAEQWVAVMSEAGVARAAGADRLAWLAYQAGAFERAEQWLAVADPTEPMTQWLQGKLALRRGEVASAMDLLAAASAAFPAGEADLDLDDDIVPEGDLPNRAPAALVQGERGVLHLAREQYAAALDHLLRAGYWSDAAYVAERVLRADELRDYVDAHWPEPAGEVKLIAWYDPLQPEARAGSIRYLLARRLTRLGRWREARAYYPPDLRPRLDAYITAIRRGHDRDLNAADRAEALWQAARIARHEGLALLGTELGPDWFAYGGQFDLGSAGDEAEHRPREGLVAASADERRRLLASLPDIDRRWHYRYVAADHAWAALALMPNDDRTAERFVLAGQWLAAHDPEAADRFYKALVIRCGQTALGREAETRRWFPPVEEPPYQPPKR